MEILPPNIVGNRIAGENIINITLQTNIPFNFYEPYLVAAIRSLLHGNQPNRIHITILNAFNLVITGDMEPLIIQRNVQLEPGDSDWRNDEGDLYHERMFDILCYAINGIPFPLTEIIEFAENDDDPFPYDETHETNNEMVNIVLEEDTLDNLRKIIRFLRGAYKIANEMQPPLPTTNTTLLRQNSPEYNVGGKNKKRRGKTIRMKKRKLRKTKRRR
jgi:hypothetical protein